MANTKFRLKRSTVSGVTPTTGDISSGELAVNLPDRKLFTSNGSAVFELGSNLNNLAVSGNLTIGSSGDLVFTNGAGIFANGGLGTAGHVLTSNGTGVYWSSAGVNTAAQYSWTNTHTFNANVRFGNTVTISNANTISVSQFAANATVNSFSVTTTRLDFGAAVTSSRGVQRSTGAVIGTNDYTALQEGIRSLYSADNDSTITAFNLSRVDTFSNGLPIRARSEVYFSDENIGTFNYIYSTVTSNSADLQVSLGANDTTTTVSTGRISVGIGVTNTVINTTSVSTGNVTLRSTGRLTLPAGAGLSANGSLGSAGDVLYSNGTSVYWANTSAGLSEIVTQQFTANGTANSFLVTGGYFPNAIEVYLAGVKQVPGTDVTITSGSTVNFAVPPLNGQVVDVFGYKAANNLQSISAIVSQQFTANGTTNTFTITPGYIPNAIEVYVSGVKRIPVTDVDITSGSTITFTTAPLNGQVVDVFGYRSVGAVAPFIDTAGGTMTGNLTLNNASLVFSGTGNRIRGDFSNATFASRALFQSSTGTFTDIGALGPAANQSAAWTAYFGSDPTNTSRMRMLATVVDGRLDSSITGTGTFLPMTFYTSNAERMRIATNGFIGIATTSPTATVHIGDTGTAADRTFRATNSHMPTGFDMLVSSGGPGGYLWVRDNSFMSLGTNNSERMRILADGTVAVGRTSALQGAQFSVRPTGDYQAAIAVGSNDSALNWARMDFKNTNAAQPTILYQDQAGTFNIRTEAAYPIRLLTNGDNERMRIAANGNIGIGTNSPSTLLHLSSTGPAVLLIEADTDNVTETDNARILLRQDGGFVQGRVGYATDTNTLEVMNESTTGFLDDLILGTSNTERMRILANGNVGIGNSAPTERLQVQGNIQLQNGASQANTVRNAGIRFWTDNAFGSELHWGDTASGLSSGWATAVYGRRTDTVAVRIGAYPAANTSQNTFSEYVTVLNNGNVGIGALSPAGRLEISSAAASHNVLQISQTNASFNTDVNLFNIANQTSTTLISKRTDGGLWFWQSNANYIASFTSGTERMRIAANGNIGIGTSLPALQLDVSGSGTQTIRAITTDTSGFAVGRLVAQYTGGGGGTHSTIDIRAGSGYSYILNGTNTPMIFGTNDSERMRIDASGRLGLGTSSPITKMTIADAVESGTRYLGNGLTSAGLFVGYNSAAYIYNDSNTPMIFGTNATERMRIDANGNVGIGTSTPGSVDSRLAVSGNFSLVTTGNKFYLYYFGATNHNYISSSPGGDLTFGAGTSGVVDRMIITPGGNVGIGTSSVSEALTVSRSSGEATLGIRNTGTSSAWLILSPGSAGAALVHNIGNASTVFTTNGTERMRIDASGNVGIGTSTPSTRLDVAGVSNIANATWAGGTDFLELTALPGSAFSEQAIVFQETGSNVGAKIGVKNRQNGAYDIIFANRDNSSLTSTMTERMRIDANGNVGIGTSTPSYRLQIFTSNANGTDGIMVAGGATTSRTVEIRPAMGSGTNNPIVQAGDSGIIFSASALNTGAFVIAPWANASSGIRIASNGFVGFSTTSPDQIITLNSTNTGVNSLVSYQQGGVTFGYSGLGTDNRLRLDGLGVDVGMGSTGARVAFFYTNNTERMRITADGNVGIGTSTPGARLDVNGNIYLRGGGGEGGEVRMFNPDGVTEGAYLDVSSADVTRWFTIRNNTLHQIGQLAGTGGVISFVTAANERGRFTAGGDFQFNSGFGSVATAYGCRAWVNFNGTGTIAIRSSGNVSSLSDNGNGDYSVNFTNAMPDANYAAFHFAGDTIASNANGRMSYGQAKATTNYRFIGLRDFSGNVLDTPENSVAIFR